MYVCGITPYDKSHLGHAMSYIIFDVIRRYLEYTRLQGASHVQNFTDIDDKHHRPGQPPGHPGIKQLAETATSPSTPPTWPP